eukprot:TRINITY_DN2766_c0_g1_i1.p1 TRINITY_DN2766_c0_g1~~TRINITY_DN2766_c0_g1_i1.p1  ORF type:complete len:176 (-),score=46.55 TRINITY_DN2766_c0_g1_i1:189-716(-)
MCIRDRRWVMRQAYMSDPAQPLERFCTLWHLTNGLWWSFGCDVLSGYFAVMPVMRKHYQTIDAKHLEPHARTGLDAVYLTELFLHVPFSLACFYTYGKRMPCRYLLEMFVFGLQIEGCVMYYLPEMLENPTTWKNWPTGGIGLYWGVGFGIVWVLLPLGMLVYRMQSVPRTSRSN